MAFWGGGGGGGKGRRPPSAEILKFCFLERGGEGASLKDHKGVGRKTPLHVSQSRFIRPEGPKCLLGLALFSYRQLPQAHDGLDFVVSHGLAQIKRRPRFERRISLQSAVAQLKSASQISVQCIAARALGKSICGLVENSRGITVCEPCAAHTSERA